MEETSASGHIKENQQVYSGPLEITARAETEKTHVVFVYPVFSQSDPGTSNNRNYFSNKENLLQGAVYINDGKVKTPN